MNSRIAVLDLGTNTLNLLVAEQSFGETHFICREKQGVALGAGSMHNKWISEEATARAIHGIQAFQIKAKALDCAQTFIFSTAVLRHATNRESVVQHIEKATGVLIEVVSGEQEAQWIAKAALHDLPEDKPSLILDIGGGSVEMIVIEQQKVQKLQSFPLGVTRLLEMRPGSNPITLEETQDLQEIFESQCSDFLKELKTHTLIGTAGVFETLVACLSSQPVDFNAPKTLDIHNLKSLLKTWQASTSEQREKLHDILPVRRKTLLIAATLLLWLIEKLSIEAVVATPNSMAEGAALDLL